MTLRKAAVLLACGALALLAAPRAWAAPDEADFGKGLERVEALEQRGRAHHGLKVLLELLEEHRDQGYVRARLALIEDLALRLAFGKVVDRPNPRSLLSGDLRTWDPRTGKIKIVYTPETAGDFELDGKLLRHPARWTGPVLLEVEGDHLEPDTASYPVVLFGGDAHPTLGFVHSWQFDFGCAAYKEGDKEVWMPASVTHRNGPLNEKVLEKDTSPLSAWGRYELVIKVDRKRIVVSVNNRPFATMEKHPDIYGSFALEIPEWEKVTFTGTLEPAWIQSKVDKAIQTQLEAFKTSYDRGTVLPSWLFELPPAAPAPAQTPAPSADLPVPPDPRHAPLIAAVRAALEKRSFGEALRAVDRLSEAGANPLIPVYLAACVRLERGEYAAALDGVEYCLEETPHYLPLLLMQGRLLRLLGRREAAAKAYDAAAARHPHVADVYVQGALDLLYADRLEAAERFVGRAAQAGLRTPTLDVLGSVLVKARRGPNWTVRHEYDSRHYTVVSDIDRRVCMEAARVLEDAYAAYERDLGRVEDGEKRRFVVYVFSGKAGFMGYQDDLRALMGKPAEKAAGLYSPLLKQLLIWNLPSRDEMLDTIRHEGSHQYLDRTMPGAPVWLDEGLAVYHENGLTERGRMRFGRPHREYVDLLKRDGLMPLRRLLAMPPREFYETGARCYAQAWAFVHMLRHGRQSDRAHFPKLLEHLRSGNEADLVEAVLPEKDLALLEEHLGTYIFALRQP